MGEGVAVLRRQPLRLPGGVVIDAGDQHPLGAVAPGGLHLADGGTGGHTDDGFDAQLRGGPGDALGVVARRAGDDATGCFLRRQGAYLVVCAPQLEGTGKLQVFRLDVHVFPQSPGRVQGRPPGDALEGCLGVFQHFHSQHRDDLLPFTNRSRYTDGLHHFPVNDYTPDGSGLQSVFFETELLRDTSHDITPKKTRQGNIKTLEA